MKHSVIQVCLSVFALCCPSVYGLTCLHCEDVPQPRHCHTVTRCEADELCLAERSATTHLYWLGCINQSLIKSLSHGSTRNGTVCSEFCGSDLCNAQACGEPGYPATRGPVCYNCNYHTDQHPCKTIDICSTDEECRIISKDEFGDTILTSGCKSRHDCQDPVVDTSIIVGKRTAREHRSSSHILCDRCCSDDLCNFNCSNDPCASSPCQHGLCVSIGKTYKCQCVAGWTGNVCSDSITTISVSTTTASSCVDNYHTCESLGAFYCTDTYRSWSILNCKHYCGWCNISTALARDCSDLVVSYRRNGTYTIYPYGVQNTSVSVYCQFDSNGAWTVIQRRFNGSVDFYRPWDDYKKGFGTANGEYWLGNDVIHEMTSNGHYELKIILSDFENKTRFAEYSLFHIGNEADGYKLTIGGYSGNAGDSLAFQDRMKFTTFDKDNDVWHGNCAVERNGAWWYKACMKSNLNGQYLSGPQDTDAHGIEWVDWHSWNVALKAATMMIKNTF